MYEIIGFKRMVGEFKDKNSGQSFPYDNVRFYVVDDQNKDGIGECPEVISVKSNLVSDLSASLIGKNIEFSYNKYGKVQKVDIF